MRACVWPRARVPARATTINNSSVIRPSRGAAAAATRSLSSLSPLRRTRAPPARPLFSFLFLFLSLFARPLDGRVSRLAVIFRPRNLNSGPERAGGRTDEEKELRLQLFLMDSLRNSSLPLPLPLPFSSQIPVRAFSVVAIPFWPERNELARFHSPQASAAALRVSSAWVSLHAGLASSGKNNNKRTTNNKTQPS